MDFLAGAEAGEGFSSAIVDSVREITSSSSAFRDSSSALDGSSCRLMSIVSSCVFVLFDLGLEGRDFATHLRREMWDIQQDDRDNRTHTTQLCFGGESKGRVVLIRSH